MSALINQAPKFIMQRAKLETELARHSSENTLWAVIYGAECIRRSWSFLRRLFVKSRFAGLEFRDPSECRIVTKGRRSYTCMTCGPVIVPG